MPGVTKDGKPAMDYGYDIGGGSKPMPDARDANIDSRSTTKKDSDRPASSYTPDYDKLFDKSGFVKNRGKLEGGWVPPGR